jgi:hypothetical protein
MFMIGGAAAWGQAQSDAAANKVDRASAYYHYTLARMYAEMAAASKARNREYTNQAIENYKAAIKADPRTPMLSEELSEIEGGRRPPLPVFSRLPSPPGRP